MEEAAEADIANKMSAKGRGKKVAPAVRRVAKRDDDDDDDDLEDEGTNRNQ